VLVVCVSSSGGGGATGTDGIWPADAELVKTQERAIAITKRFMVVLLQVEDAKVLTWRRIDQLPKLLARG
jgi:hypothetical protein